MFDYNAWYICAKSDELKDFPIKKSLLGRELVIFRDSFGNPYALKDRCCHRGVPLSKGKVNRGVISCPYHGWKFNGEGKCIFIPELEGNQKIPKSACVESYPLYETGGFIWTYMGGELEYEKRAVHPNILTLQDPDIKGVVNSSKEINCYWMHMVENILDGAHLPYVHNGSLENGNRWIYNWSQKFRRKKKQESPNNLKIEPTETGFTAHAEDSIKKKKSFCDQYLGFSFKVYFPSTVQIELNYPPKKVRVWVHVIPISENKCRVEHVFYRNFLTHSIFNPIFKKSAKRFLKEDITIVQYQQRSYDDNGYVWENSCARDRIPLFFRSQIKGLCRNVKEFIDKN